MKGHTAFIHTTICVILTGLFLAMCYGCHSKKVPPLDLPCQLLHSGDLVFRRGTGLLSRAVLSVNDKSLERRYSHVGILYLNKDSAWMVIHAVPGEADHKDDPDRVKMDSLSVFFSGERAKSGEVMRVTVDTLLAWRAATHAYNLYEKGVAFDHQYNLADTSSLYCTELVDYVYRQQGVDLREDRISEIHIPGLSGSYLLPSDIQKSSLLFTVFYF